MTLVFFVAGLLALGQVRSDDVPVIPPHLAPIILTDTPSPTPFVPRHALGYVSIPVGGGYDSIRTPSPTPDPPTPTPYNPGGSIEAIFLAGWADGGGLQFKGPASAWRFAFCESSGNVVTAGSFLGLLQFAPRTWGIIAAITGQWNAFSSYEQGYNGARWAELSDPYQQWPNCWNA